MANPAPPFNNPVLSNYDGMLLAPGSFYDWQVGGAVYEAAIICTVGVDNITYASLPKCIVQTNVNYTLPAYSPLNLNRARLNAVNRGYTFNFIVTNTHFNPVTISPNTGFIFTAFTLLPGSSAYCQVYDSGLQALLYFVTDPGGTAGGSITVNTSGPLSVTGSPVPLNGSITLTDTALDEIPTESWRAGPIALSGSRSIFIATGNSIWAPLTNRSIGIGANIRVGGNQQLRIGSRASTAPPPSDSPDIVCVGHNAGESCHGTIGEMVFVGNQAGSSMVTVTSGVVIGHNAGNSSANGIGNFTIVGERTQALGNFAAALGSQAQASTNGIAIGRLARADTEAVVVGSSAGNAFLNNSVVIGHGSANASTAANTNNVIIGRNSATATAISNLIVVGNGSGLLATGGGCTIIGHQSGTTTTTGANTTIVGSGSGTANLGAGNTIVGQGAGLTVTGAGNTIIGQGAVTATLTTGTNNVVIGQTSGVTLAAAASCVVIGQAATVNQTQAVIIGGGASATGTTPVVIGQGSSVTGNGGIVVGRGTTASGASTITVGTGNTTSSGANSVILGTTASNTQTDVVVVGHAAVSTGTNAVVVGKSSTASADRATAIGRGLTNATANSTLIGSDTSPTAHVVRSTGYIFSTVTDAISVQNTGPITIVNATRLTIGTTALFNDVRGGTALDTPNNQLVLLQAAKAYLITMYIQATLTTTVTAGARAVRARLSYDNNSVVTVIARDSFNTNTTNTTFDFDLNASAIIKTSVSGVGQRVFVGMDLVSIAGDIALAANYIISYTVLT